MKDIIKQTLKTHIEENPQINLDSISAQEKLASLLEEKLIEHLNSKLLAGQGNIYKIKN